MQIVSRSWRRLVKPEAGKIDRHAYTFCALEALREGLHRRDVFVRRSDRWGDPRSVLLPDRGWTSSHAASATATRASFPSPTVTAKKDSSGRSA
jgi:hypothetical protein